MTSDSMVRKCHHDQTPFVMGKETVYLSALKDADRNRVGKSVDLGVYLDPAWLTGRVAGLVTRPMLYLGWPDMQPFPSIGYLDLAIKRVGVFLEKGKRVEIGCIGGHGRTGSFVAALVIKRLGLDAKEAIKMVRSGYCEKAVETQGQERMLKKYKEWLEGNA